MIILYYGFGIVAYLLMIGYYGSKIDVGVFKGLHYLIKWTMILIIVLSIVGNDLALHAM